MFSTLTGVIQTLQYFTQAAVAGAVAPAGPPSGRAAVPSSAIPTAVHR